MIFLIIVPVPIWLVQQNVFAEIMGCIYSNSTLIIEYTRPKGQQTDRQLDYYNYLSYSSSLPRQIFISSKRFYI